MINKNKQNGFTIVELLIVIVVIGILAVITTVTFNGVQNRARTTKINADLMMLSKAISAARINSGEQALRYVTSSTGTAGTCMSKPAGTDLEMLDKNIDSCWISYRNALQAISSASNMNVMSLVDPWGRPYVLDENEKEGTTNPCGLASDYIGTFARPLTGGWSTYNVMRISYITPGCS